MKKLLFTLLLIPCMSWAAPSITQMIVTRNTENGEDFFMIQAYGLTDNGSPKFVPISKANIGSSSVKAFYQAFSLQRDVARYIIYFKADGTVETINFQLADPFQNLKNEGMKSSADIDLTDLKAFVENYIPPK